MEIKEFTGKVEKIIKIGDIFGITIKEGNNYLFSTVGQIPNYIKKGLRTTVSYNSDNKQEITSRGHTEIYLSYGIVGYTIP
jgi:hypothetical protein